MNDFEIVPIDEVPLNGILAALDKALGRNCDESWFIWKHIDNPYGKSLGWVATGKEGVLGVRLFMKWDLQCGTRTVHALRPVDTATVPSARRQGIFRELTKFAIGAVANNSDVDLIFNTPNKNSAPGYASLGWTVLPPLAHGFWPVMPGPTASIQSDDEVFDAFEHAVSDPGRLCTQYNSSFMRWRYNSRSGISYGKARLSQARAPNGIFYRVTHRRWIRLLIVNALVGTPEERRVLLRSVGRSENALAFLMAIGTGAANFVESPCIRRGRSVLAVRPLLNCTPDPTKLDSWALTLGDLEDII
jgi:hypothetical protein